MSPEPEGPTLGRKLPPSDREATNSSMNQLSGRKRPLVLYPQPPPLPVQMWQCSHHSDGTYVGVWHSNGVVKSPIRIEVPAGLSGLTMFPQRSFITMSGCNERIQA